MKRKIVPELEGECAIHVGRFTVAPFPEGSPHHGAIFEVSADILKLQNVPARMTFYYSVGWTAYDISGYTGTFEQARENAITALWEMYSNWTSRGDDPTAIAWNTEA